MAEVKEAVGSARSDRRAPNVHSEAVQEAKRLQKMQTISSSHRSGAPVARPDPAKDASP